MAGGGRAERAGQRAERNMKKKEVFINNSKNKGGIIKLKHKSQNPASFYCRCWIKMLKVTKVTSYDSTESRGERGKREGRGRDPRTHPTLLNVHGALSGQRYADRVARHRAGGSERPRKKNKKEGNRKGT